MNERMKDETQQPKPPLSSQDLPAPPSRAPPLCGPNACPRLSREHLSPGDTGIPGTMVLVRETGLGLNSPTAWPCRLPRTKPQRPRPQEPRGHVVWGSGKCVALVPGVRARFLGHLPHLASFLATSNPTGPLLSSQSTISYFPRACTY